nr:hypothetical protein Itr_chr12CG04200 [Ipomoea trifida]
MKKFLSQHSAILDIQDRYIMSVNANHDRHICVLKHLISAEQLAKGVRDSRLCHRWGEV